MTRTGERGGPPHRRSATAVLLFTVLGVIPGAGLLAAGRRRSGLTVLVVFVVGLIATVLWVGTSTSALLSRALDTSTLQRAAVAVVILAAAWSAIVVISHRALRPAGAGPGERVAGSALAGVLCLAVSLPLVLGANVLLTTRQTINGVLSTAPKSELGGGATIGPITPVSSTPIGSASASAVPSASAPAETPWSKRRLNILIIGSDAAPDRTGTRTDSMVIASIDTVTGKVLLISIPRNLCRLDWNPNSALGKLYPQGWTHSQGDCDTSGDGDDLINAIYNDVPIAHPELFPPGSTDNPGADALGLGLQYSLQLSIDYYLLVDLDAFKPLVDAIGGVVVNVNTPIPVGGQHDAATGQIITQYPSRWIMPGRGLRLDGRNALWFARGRFASDDYARIDRQQCTINAIIAQTTPTKLLTSYASLAATLEGNVKTDIPRGLLEPLAQLGLKIRAAGARSSITIRQQTSTNPGIPGLGSSNPDWALASAAIRQAIAQTDRTTTVGPSAKPTASASVSSGPAGSSPATSGPATPSPTATTSGGSNITTNVGASCRYDPVAAAAATAAWKQHWGGMYNSQGERIQ